MTRNPTQRPDSEANEPVGEIELHELDDGTWYFLLCDLGEDEACSRSSSRRILIDTTMPEEFEITIRRKEGRYIAEFWPYDVTSGIQSLKVSFDASVLGESGLDATDEALWEDVASPYTLPKGLVDDIMFRATDDAGKTRIVKISAPSGLCSAVYMAIAVVLFL